MDALSAEEVNLADELRGAIADGDVGALVQLLAALGLFWTIRGEHGRLIVLTDAVADAVRDWQPPRELEDATRAALTTLLSNAMIAGRERIEPVRAMLRRLDSAPGGDPRLAGTVKVMAAYDPGDVDAFLHRLEHQADDRDRHMALAARHMLSHARENAGDPAGAVEAAERALKLVADGDGPWQAAILRTQLAQLMMHLGHRRSAQEHARAALPVLRRLGATDDEVQLRALLGLCAIAEGRLEDAERRARANRPKRGDRGHLRRGRGPADRPRGAGHRPWPGRRRLAYLSQMRRRDARPPVPRPSPHGIGAVGAVRRRNRPDGACPPGRRPRRSSRARAVRNLPGARPPGSRHRECAPGLSGRRDGAVRAWRVGAPAPGGAGGRRGSTARARGAIRLQPDDSDDGLGADRAARRGGGSRPYRRVARRVRRAPPAGPPGGGPASGRTAARGAACSCAPTAARRSRSRQGRPGASSPPRR